MGLIRRGGPTPRRRARSLEAGLLRLRAEHACTSVHVRPHAGKWDGGGSPSFPARHAPCAHAWAEEGTRAAGRNGAPRHRARRLARARPAPTARYVRGYSHMCFGAFPPDSIVKDGTMISQSSCPYRYRFISKPANAALLGASHDFPRLSTYSGESRWSTIGMLCLYEVSSEKR